MRIGAFVLCAVHAGVQLDARQTTGLRDMSERVLSVVVQVLATGPDS